MRSASTVLCLGNSTTYNGVHDGTDWPTLASKASGVPFVNAGVSSNSLKMMGARLPLLMDAHRPSHVIICGGSVEIQSAGLYNLGYIITDLDRIVNYVRSRGAVPVVASVPPMGCLPGSTVSRHSIAVALYTRQGNYAANEGLQFVDFMRPLANDLGWAQRDLFRWKYQAPHEDQWDDIHPSETGRALMADAALTIL